MDLALNIFSVVVSLCWLGWAWFMLREPRAVAGPEPAWMREDWLRDWPGSVSTDQPKEDTP